MSNVKILTADDLISRTDVLTVGKLKEFIKKHNLQDDAVVLIERVEDVYYEKYGWGVYLKEGFEYNNVIRGNKDIQNEIDRRERGEQAKYPRMKNPALHIINDENILNSFKNQYTTAHCATFYNDENHLFINLHY